MATKESRFNFSQNPKKNKICNVSKLCPKLESKDGPTLMPKMGPKTDQKLDRKSSEKKI